MEEDTSGSDSHSEDFKDGAGGLADTLCMRKEIRVQSEEDIGAVARLKKKYKYSGKVVISRMLVNAEDLRKYAVDAGLKPVIR